MPVPLGMGDPMGMCLTTTHGWIQTHYDQVVSFDGTSVKPHELPGYQLVACTPDAALLIDHGHRHYAMCKEICEPVATTGLRRGPATIANGKLYTVQARGRVLGVWRQDLPPLFFSAPESLEPGQVTTDGNVLDVLAMTRGGPVIARIPLRD